MAVYISYQSRSPGLLLLRVGLGAMLAVLQGWPGLSGGPERWAQLAEPLRLFGVTTNLDWWGLAASCLYFMGGILLILGLFTRVVALGLATVMGIAAAASLRQGAGIAGAAYAIERGIVFFSLIFIGAGRFSIDHFLRR